MTYTPEHLTNLLTTGQHDELTRICAEVCYGWESVSAVTYKTKQGEYIHINDFQPLADTEKGRSQAFELAVNFHCWPKMRNGHYVVFITGKFWIEHENPQAAIVIAAILTAQQENNDE